METRKTKAYWNNKPPIPEGKVNTEENTSQYKVLEEDGEDDAEVEAEEEKNESNDLKKEGKKDEKKVEEEEQNMQEDETEDDNKDRRDNVYEIEDVSMETLQEEVKWFCEQDSNEYKMMKLQYLVFQCIACCNAKEIENIKEDHYWVVD